MSKKNMVEWCFKENMENFVCPERIQKFRTTEGKINAVSWQTAIKIKGKRADKPGFT